MTNNYKDSNNVTSFFYPEFTWGSGYLLAFALVDLSNWKK